MFSPEGYLSTTMSTYPCPSIPPSTPHACVLLELLPGDMDELGYSTPVVSPAGGTRGSAFDAPSARSSAAGGRVSCR